VGRRAHWQAQGEAGCSHNTRTHTRTRTAHCSLRFNAHRIYGRLRFPLFTKGWKLEDSEAFSEDIWGNGGGWQVQPVYYLINKD
jgi:hypothetical protein